MQRVLNVKKITMTTEQRKKFEDERRERYFNI